MKGWRNCGMQAGNIVSADMFLVMTDPTSKARIRDAYALAEEEEVRVARLKELVAEANTQGKDGAELEAFAETAARKAADLRRVADMLASTTKH